MWNDFKSSFQHILDDLHRHKNLIESQAHVAEYQKAQAERLYARQAFEDIQNSQRRQALVSVHDWLSAPDTETDHKSACAIRSEYPESGEWLRKVPMIRTWIDEKIPPRQCVWLNGIPGAGLRNSIYRMKQVTDVTCAQARQS